MKLLQKVPKWSQNAPKSSQIDPKWSKMSVKLAHKFSQNVPKWPGIDKLILIFSSFYQKYTVAFNIPVLGSLKVSDEALRRACYVLHFMLSDRRDIRREMKKGKAWVIINLLTNSNHSNG